jgi:hypothetical protein
LIEGSLVLGGAAMSEIESKIQTLICTHKTDLLNHTIGQSATSFRKVGGLAQTNILGTKDEFN